jgi:hypothetical protein
MNEYDCILLLQGDQLQSLIASATTLKQTQLRTHPDNKPVIITTIAAINYKSVVLNWIHHMNRLQVDNYLLICVDREIETVINDTRHTVLIEPFFRLHFAPTSQKTDNMNRKVNTMIMNKESKFVRLNNNNNNKNKEFQRISKGSRQLSVKYDEYELGAVRQEIERRIVLTNPHLLGPSKHNKDMLPRLVDFCFHKLEKINSRFPFSLLMILKHTVLATLLQAKDKNREDGLAVVWSDADAVWLRPCVLDSIQAVVGSERKEAIDFAAQQGLFPYEVSDIWGSAICTGLMIINPTESSIRTFQLVRDKLLSLLMSKTSCGDGCKGDQKLLNYMLLRVTEPRYPADALISYGNLTFDAGTMQSSSMSSQLQILRRQFIDTNGSINVADINLDNVQAIQALPAPRTPVANTQPLSIAFLPYQFFPRGDARTETDMEANTLKGATGPIKGTSTSRNGPNREPQQGRMKSNVEEQAEKMTMMKRNWLEWGQSRSHACVWHMFALKSAGSKVDTMRRDGVYLS